MITIIKNKINKGFFAYTFTVILSVIILIFLLKLWRADIEIPFTYSIDGLFTSATIKGIIENGWFFENNYVGAPFGQQMYDYPATNILDIIIMKSISLFFPNFGATFNIFFILTFPLTTLLTMIVLRQLQFSYITSAVGSLLFTFAPFHFLRGRGILFYQHIIYFH